MNSCEKESDCESPYMYMVFKIKGSPDWNFHIGKVPPRENEEPSIIATQGGYKTEEESRASAIAFIDGMLFAYENPITI